MLSRKTAADVKTHRKSIVRRTLVNVIHARVVRLSGSCRTSKQNSTGQNLN